MLLQTWWPSCGQQHLHGHAAISTPGMTNSNKHTASVSFAAGDNQNQCIQAATCSQPALLPTVQPPQCDETLLFPLNLPSII